MNEKNVEAMFKLTPPSGVPFHAAVVRVGAGYVVFSRRGDAWAPEEAITLADLVYPEQRLGEWDVEAVQRSA